MDWTETSKTIGLIRYLNERFDAYCRGSRISSVYESSSHKIRSYFVSSLLGKVTDTSAEGGADTGRIAAYIASRIDNKQSFLTAYAGSSRVMVFIRDIGGHIYAAPVRALSVIIVSAIIINTALSFLSGITSGWFGWIMRAVFLSIGLCGLSCNAPWQSLKDSSLLLKSKEKVR